MAISPHSALLRVLLSACILTLSSAVFEDQAREYSWNKQFVGRVKNALFAPRGKDRVFVATDASVIASIDVRSGELQWRKVLDEEDVPSALGLLHKPPSLVSLSRNGTRLRAWQASDGALLWDSPECLGTGTTEGTAAFLMLPDLDKDGQMDIALVCSSKLVVSAGDLPKRRDVTSVTHFVSGELHCCKRCIGLR